MLIFGRAAMGEDVHRGFCRDAWRVRRDGKLVFADTPAASTAPSPRTLDRPAPLDGARATALVLYFGRRCSGSPRRRRVRYWKGRRAAAGASTWNGLLVVRAHAARRPHAAGRSRARLELLAGRAAAARVAVLMRDERCRGSAS